MNFTKRFTLLGLLLAALSVTAAEPATRSRAWRSPINNSTSLRNSAIS